MAGETDPVLARMLAKVAAWQAAVDSYRAALALEQSALNVEAQPRASAIELPLGAFRGMKIPEAIKLFLEAARRKQTAREIAAGLRDGGVETTSRNFEATVTGALHRLKTDGVVLRFKDGWDLAEAHSASLRSRLAKDNGKPPKKRTTPKVVRPRAKGPSLDERIVAFVSSRPMDWFTPAQVMSAIDEANPNRVSLALARLIRYGRIARDADGRYAAPKNG